MSEQTQSEVPALPRLTAVVDIFENDDHYLVRADVPGVDKDHVEISFHEGKLSFEATLESERVYTRTLGFGDDVDPDAIEAKLEHGVLEVRLPKREKVGARKISVTTH